MLPDQGEADSFYYDALSDYIDACDATTELYAEGKTPDTASLIAEGLRFSSAFKKLAYVIKVANGKFGKQFIMPQFLFDTKYWEKPQ